MYLLSPVHTCWLAATTIATTTTTGQESLLDFLGDPLVCKLKSGLMFVNSGMLPGRPEAVKRETPYLLTLSFKRCHGSKAA